MQNPEKVLTMTEKASNNLMNYKTLSIIPLFWREIRLNIFSWYAFVNNFFIPILHIVMFAYAFSANIKGIYVQGKMVDYILFFLPGLIGIQVFQLFATTFSLVRLDFSTNILAFICTSASGHIEEYAIGKIGGVTLVAIIKTIPLLIIGALLGISSGLNLVNYIYIFLFVILGGVIWGSIGFILGILIKKEDVRDLLFALLVTPITFASSAYYATELIPKWISIISKINPLTFLVDALRSQFMGTAIKALDLCVLILLAIVSLIAALMMIRNTSFK